MADATRNAADPVEKKLASRANSATGRRVVLHLEPYNGPHSALFPVGFAAGVLQKLKGLMRDVDPNPLVVNIARTRSAGLPWTVS